MRRILALILAVVMLTAVSVPVFAADAPDQSNWSSLVTYGVEQSYVVTIPSDLYFSKAKVSENGKTAGWVYEEQSVSLSNVIISGQEKIVVCVASPDQFRLDDGRYLTDKGPWYLIDTMQESMRVRYFLSTSKFYGEGASTSDACRNGSVVLAVDRMDGNAGTSGSSGQSKLYFSSMGTAQEGVYRDRLTFTVEVQNAGYSATESRH